MKNLDINMLVSRLIISITLIICVIIIMEGTIKIQHKVTGNFATNNHIQAKYHESLFPTF